MEPLVVEDVEIEEPKAGEVLVKVAAAGVCHSDLHFMEGLWPAALPAILGHEGAGVVERVGEGVRVLAEVDGQLVVGIVPVSHQLDLKALAAAVGGKRATMAATTEIKGGSVLATRTSPARASRQSFQPAAR